VLLLRPGDGGRLSCSTNCSDVAHVPTQVFATVFPLLELLEEELDELELLEELLEELDELLELDELVELVELDELLELEELAPSPLHADNAIAVTSAKGNFIMVFIVSPSYRCEMQSIECCTA
jgi:hypothetical protein